MGRRQSPTQRCHQCSYQMPRRLRFFDNQSVTKCNQRLIRFNGAWGAWDAPVTSQRVGRIRLDRGSVERRQRAEQSKAKQMPRMDQSNESNRSIIAAKGNARIFSSFLSFFFSFFLSFFSPAHLFRFCFRNRQFLSLSFSVFYLFFTFFLSFLLVEIFGRKFPEKRKRRRRRRRRGRKRERRGRKKKNRTENSIRIVGMEVTLSFSSPSWGRILNT